MELITMEKHDGYGNFPTFAKGTAVALLGVDDEYPHWHCCVIDGFETFVADIYVTEGVLNQDYNPAELIVDNCRERYSA